MMYDNEYEWNDEEEWRKWKINERKAMINNEYK